MATDALQLDVLCVGNAALDLVFTVPFHPGPDEKCEAEALLTCGGGPAANAAVAMARLGLRAGFAGYLGNDPQGQLHFEELLAEGVETSLISRGDAPTRTSTIYVKPGGQRSVVHYGGLSEPLEFDTSRYGHVSSRVILFDGFEPQLAEGFLELAHRVSAITVLDAGSVREGTRLLADKVDHLVAAKSFAMKFTGASGPRAAAQALAEHASHVVVTVGADGLVWIEDGVCRSMPAFPVTAIDTTGAGDAFHAAYAAGLLQGLGGEELLRRASAAAALCCMQLGARPGMPTPEALEEFLGSEPPSS